MKNFTEADLQNGNYLYADSTDLVDSPLWWQLKGLQQTASGYGKKLTTHWKISFNGKLYRVYATCFGNVASCWFTVKRRHIFVD